MPSENKAVAGDRSPSKHDKAPHKKESRSRSRADQHRRSKSKSRDRRGRGSNEEVDGKRHRASRRHSRSRSPSRSHSRGKSAFLGSRQYSPPRKRPRQSRSRSASPATLLVRTGWAVFSVRLDLRISRSLPALYCQKRACMPCSSLRGAGNCGTKDQALAVDLMYV